MDEALGSGHEALLEIISGFEVPGGEGVSVEIEAEGGEGEDGGEDGEGGGGEGKGGDPAGGSGAANGDEGQRLASEAQEKLNV